MKSYGIALTFSLLMNPIMSQAATVETDQTASIIVSSQQAHGFMDWVYDKSSGQLFMEVKQLNQPFLLVTSLPQGVGSNDIGLDRGQLGNSRLVQFERLGPYTILRQLNPNYRANTQNTAEKEAVKDAFAESILWRSKILSGKKTLVMMNDLVINDLHGVIDTLKYTEQGSYQLDKNKSLIIPEGVKSFEKNSDVDVLLTFNGNQAGQYAKQVTPDANFISIKMRYSFIALPELGYTPRTYHPMSGYLSDSYLDYAQPITNSVQQWHLLRHRLKKINPGSAPSEVIEPIVYYLDSGAPEPIRSALLDGARWWSKAFEKAGFINGFQVEMLPEGADPQDMRYNVIQWVHRATRGWSYGSVITDPRTGEILKGHVTLGSLRVRQDHLIARGLTAGWNDRTAADKAAMDLALARIRQLSAHEIGHTLGLDHNFASSSNDNASVMDYPHPYISLKQGKIDISQPYSVGVGEWDNFTIQYGYGEYDAGQNPAKQQQLQIESALKQGLSYIGESDSRAKDASQIYASLWDNGSDAVAELIRLGQVRKVAIEGFNHRALLGDQPLGELSDAFVPIYLLTRFQINAAAKLIGGSNYSFVQDKTSSWHFVAPEQQKAALNALLNTIMPSSLEVPVSVLQYLVPKSGNYRATRESFASGLGVLPDQLGMAEVLSRHTVTNLLMPRRLNRVNQAYIADREQLSVSELINELLDTTLLKRRKTGTQTGIWMRVNAVVVDALLQAVRDPQTAPEIQALLSERLQYAVSQLERKAKRADDYQAAHFQWLANSINKGLTDAEFHLINEPLPMPPGSPI
ncbi:DUF5117 domain-containing protein [Parashewanella spongiae]|uniref:DUF5117 domain-containing protein n=1 Tax=Parashewanella spongiae TaxID=342950 RepID=A0A3A6TTE4_9GAMM|nr:zinc-dependent metalloprotease [Parashewanella spongiae]MCL1078954.1 zinc-dependent metalloprotease [Parashewanella spongiae]RJY15200.1 DUF5117 domain-containing protein [Parashewanella spongiae]